MTLYELGLEGMADQKPKELEPMVTVVVAATSVAADESRGELTTCGGGGGEGDDGVGGVEGGAGGGGGASGCVGRWPRLMVIAELPFSQCPAWL